MAVGEINSLHHFFTTGKVPIRSTMNNFVGPSYHVKMATSHPR